MTILLGFLGLFGLAAALALGTSMASSSVARAVGVGSFELFDAERPQRLWKEGVIRGAGVMAPFLVVAGLYTLASLVGGELVPTTTVDVLPGPARDAGMREGDTVVEIDRQPIGDWQTLLAAIRASRAAREVVVERDGQRATLSVTPNDAGRIGIESHYERRPAGLAFALRTGFRMPFEVVTSTFATVVNPPKKADLMGPVGIVRTTARTDTTRFGTLLGILGLLGAHAWLAFPLMHLIDMASLFAFQRKYPAERADEGQEQVLELRRIARRRGLLNAFLVVWVPFVVLWALVAPEDPGPVSLLPQVWLSPIFFTLTWQLARSLYGRATAALWSMALFVPCLPLVLLLVLSSRAQAHLREKGFVRAPPIKAIAKGD